MSAASLTTRSRLKYAGIGFAVIAGVAATPVLMETRPWQAEPHHFTAVFGRAGQGMDSASDVRLHGVKVGGVDSVRLDRHGRVVVGFRVSRGIRLPADTVVSAEPVSVFGPKEIDLEPGPRDIAGPYLADGATITRTRDPQEISDTAAPLSHLTSAVNPDDVAGLVHTLAQGLDGEGPALQRDIANGDTLVGQAYTRRRDLQQALVDLENLADTLGNRGGEVTTLVGNATSLSALVDDQDKIGQLLTRASQVSAGADDLLAGQGSSLGTLADAASGVVGTLHASRANIPVMLNGLASLLGGLGNVINVPGPGGTTLGRIAYSIVLDPCYEISDLCRVLPRPS